MASPTPNPSAPQPHSADAAGNRARLFWQRIAFRAKQAVRGVLEQAYARRLHAKIAGGPVPNHLALVLDGNRRYARMAGLRNVADGHRAGAGKVTEVIRWCDELQIQLVTLWALSTDNLDRSKAELDALYAAIADELEELKPGAAAGGNRQVRSIGRLELLPDGLRRQLEELETLTAGAGPWRLNIAVAYGGRDELIDAFRKLLRESGANGESPDALAERFNAATLGRYLYVPDAPEPDLIIRTSGETRLSGFLLWQSAFSELYFCDTLWPAFRWLDFLRAIRSYQGRKRRFGL